MDIDDVEEIVSNILTIAHKSLINDNRERIRNERYYHHMFSTLVHQKFIENGIDTWNPIILRPERLTTHRFLWKGDDFSNANFTKDFSIDMIDSEGFEGKSGNVDFSISEASKVLIEWKGPGLFSKVDVIKDMLKLLSDDIQSIKVFAAIVTSSKTGPESHRIALREHLGEGIVYACKVLDINDISTSNLYVYVASIYNNDNIDRVHWGRLSQESMKEIRSFIATCKK